MKFNENLKFLRKQANLTQEKLAEELNVSRQAITKWESGQSMPDIENLKELSYIFSISIDSLVGDIESKSSLRIHKKINDIGWFIFAFFIVYVFIIISVNEFVVYMTNTEEFVLPTVASMIIVGIFIFIISIKKWLNEKETIIDLTNTEKGRKMRKKILIKKVLTVFICLIFLILIQNLPTRAIGTNIWVKDLIQGLIFTSILTIILGVIYYKKMQKMVKEFNENINTDEKVI